MSTGTPGSCAEPAQGGTRGLQPPQPHQLQSQAVAQQSSVRTSPWVQQDSCCTPFYELVEKKISQFKARFHDVASRETPEVEASSPAIACNAHRES